MADQPKNTYALGVFCELVRPYVTQYSRTTKGFMKDYFDAIIDTEELEKDPSPHENPPSPGKTSITAGAWKGINETDLAKFFNGRRKLPAWKASRFHQHLDQSRIEELCSEISIDALSRFQANLAEYGIAVKTVDEIPTAVYQWLAAILETNARNQDLLADNLRVPVQVTLFQGIPLAEGKIAGGKLHLGRSSLPWPDPPAVPATPDPNLEAGYTSQILAAISDHLKETVTDPTALSAQYQEEFARHRHYFYGAEGVRRNLRDAVEDGEHEFDGMKTDLYDGVVNICESDHADGLVRMRSTLAYAGSFTLNGSVITRFPSIIEAAEKQGMCHMLANDERLHWVRRDD